jgi:polyene glycosyltransferase
MPISPGPMLFAGAAHAGHLNPLAAIAGELSRRGVRDLWFASEEAARTRIEQIAAARFVSYGETALRIDETVYSAMTGGPRTTAGMVALARLVRGTHVDRFFRHSLEQIDRIRPVLMVIDVLNIGALDAAMLRGVPFILSVPFAVSGVYLRRLPWRYPTPTSGLPERMTATQTLASMAFRLRLQLAMVRSLEAGALRRRRKAGLANVLSDPERYATAARAVFAYSVFGLEYPFDPPAHLHMLGPMMPDAPEPARSELTEWLDARRSVVYVCMGTMARLSADQVRELADGLSRLGPDHHVLWKLPPEQRALLPEALPAHIGRRARASARTGRRLSRRGQHLPRECPLRTAGPGHAVLAGLLRRRGPGRGRRGGSRPRASAALQRRRGHGQGAPPRGDRHVPAAQPGVGRAVASRGWRVPRRGPHHPGRPA